MKKTPEEIKKGLEYCKGDVHLCRHCPYYNYIGLGCTRLRDADALAYIRQLEEGIGRVYDQAKDLQLQLGVWTGKDMNVPCWIRVEERMPDVGDLVLVIANGNPRANIELRDAILIASYCAEEGWIADGFEGWDGLKVSRWMPLPELPSGCDDK